MIEDETICHFYPSEIFWDKTQELYNAEKENLIKLLHNIDVTIELYGGSSIPGSLARKELDIQIRTKNKDHKKVTLLMKKYAPSKREDVWSPTLSIFSNEEKEFPVDYAVTVFGSPIEKRFCELRDILKKEPLLLEEYNTMKKSFEGKAYKEYGEAKRNFVKKILSEYTD